MFPRLERFLLGPRFACIEAEMQPAGLVFHLTLLRRKGSRAELVAAKASIRTASALKKLIDGKVPVLLVLTGKGIISRKVSAESGASDATLVSKVLPNADASELVVSRYPVGEATCLVSLVRKDHVTTVADSLNGFSLIGVMVGPGAVLGVRSALEVASEELRCGRHMFRFAGDDLLEVNYATGSEGKAKFRIGEEKLNGENLVSFAAALSGLTHTGSVPGEAAGFSAWRKNFIHMKRYGAAVKGSVALVFLVLLINFFCFSHFRSLRSELEEQPGANSGSMVRFHELSAKVEARKDFLVASGLIDNSSFAWMADQLAQEIPDDIVLSRVNFSPAENFSREDTLGFRAGALHISGTCKESSSLNNWLKQLQKAKWITTAGITSYSDAGNSTPGKFELDLAFR